MERTELIPVHGNARGGLPTPRDIVAVGFRRQRVMGTVFLCTIAFTLLAAVFQRDYESQMKILVRKGRVDPVLSPDAAPGNPMIRTDVTEEDLNSEIELLQSKDLLTKVVRNCSLEKKENLFPWTRWMNRRSSPEDLRVARAVRKLSNKLDAEVAKKSNVIIVSYRGGDGQSAAFVLRTLAKLYAEKQVEVQRPAGQFAFFDSQVEESRKRLEEGEARLAQFSRDGGTVAGQLERDIAVQKLGDMRVALEYNRAAIAEAKHRITTLEQLKSNAPQRLTTIIKTADNPQLMQQLKGTLLTLELKRTELLHKFHPTYRPVVEIEEEIAKAKAAITDAERNPLKDQTTDLDPTYEWIRAELAKATADLHALGGRAASAQASITDLEAKTRRLNESGIAQQDFVRTVKALQDNYELYLRKREEARITDALDQSRILNVAIAQPPTVPVLPARSPIVILCMGFVLALFASTGAVFVAEHFDNSFRTPDEVRQVLSVPVLAALPAGSEPENQRQ